MGWKGVIILVCCFKQWRALDTIADVFSGLLNIVLWSIHVSRTTSCKTLCTAQVIFEAHRRSQFNHRQHNDFYYGSYLGGIWDEPNLKPQFQFHVTLIQQNRSAWMHVSVCKSDICHNILHCITEPEITATGLEILKKGKPEEQKEQHKSKWKGNVVSHKVPRLRPFALKIRSL